MGRKQTVMIVEDEALLLLDNVMTVENLGYEVHSECANLDEAFAALKAGPPELALLDVNIRRELIWPVARALKKADCKIVFVSADLAYKELSTEFSDCATVEKPASADDIGSALKQAAGAC